MKKFALIGNPISHSLSPALFYAAYPQTSSPTSPNSSVSNPSSSNTSISDTSSSSTSISDTSTSSTSISDTSTSSTSISERSASEFAEQMSYELVQEDSIEESMKRIKQGGYNGCNVTAPFKEEAMCYVTDPSAVCKALQATNLLLFKEDHTYAFNTDYLAVRRLLQENQKCDTKHHLAHPTETLSESECSQCPEIRDTGNKKGQKCSQCPEIRDTGNTVLVIGCGGAGKAAALAAKDEGFNTLITNRTEEKAAAFAKSIDIKAISQKEAHFLLSSLIDPQSNHSCNSNPETNSCRTKTETNSCSNRLLVIYTLPQKDELLYPLLLNLSTRLIGIIEANYKDPCLNPTSGRKWLLYQAVESFRLMTGMEPSLASMKEVITL